MKTLGRLCLMIGIALIAAATIWHVRNFEEENRAERVSYERLALLEAAMTDASATGAATQEEPVRETETSAREDAPTEAEMPVAVIDGVEYIGVLRVPTLEIELPVQADWSEEKLKDTPCRFAGSAAGGDLIIAGHNYRRHFTPLKQLTVGDAVDFTDVAEKVYRYTVCGIEVIGGNDAEGMLSGAEDWDLTLFTCTYGGGERLTIRCARAEE